MKLPSFLSDLAEIILSIVFAVLVILGAFVVIYVAFKHLIR